MQSYQITGQKTCPLQLKKPYSRQNLATIYKISQNSPHYQENLPQKSLIPPIFFIPSSPILLSPVRPPLPPLFFAPQPLFFAPNPLFRPQPSFSPFSPTPIPPVSNCGKIFVPAPSFSEGIANLREALNKKIKKFLPHSEPNPTPLVIIVHSKITFSIARNVIMIGLLFNEELP